MGAVRSVALITPRYAPSIGGVEWHVQMLATGLASRSITVEVVTADPSGRLPAIEEMDGVVVRRFPTVGRSEVYSPSLALSKWLLRNSSRFDLLHAHSYHTILPLQSAACSKLLGIPLVITPHYHGTGHSPFRRLLHRPYHFVGKWAISRAVSVICVSEAERTLIHRDFGSGVPTTVIPNGASIDQLPRTRNNGKSTGVRTVLCAGRLEHYKHVDKVISALSHLPKDFRVVVLGDGPDRHRLEEHARHVGVAERVLTLGFVTRDELIEWYGLADIFVSLSDREAFGLTVLDASVAGSKVVASDIPAHREVAEYLPAGVVSLVSPDCSALQLAETILQASARNLLSDPENWAVPRWSDAIDGALRCYHLAVAKRQIETSAAEEEILP